MVDHTKKIKNEYKEAEYLQDRKEDIRNKIFDVKCNKG